MAILYAAVADLPAREVRERAPGEAAPLPRLPALEGLVARGEVRPAPSDWRRWALARAGLEAVAGDLPLGRLLAAAAGLRVEASDTWLAVAPLSLRAGLSAVRVGDTAIAPDAAGAARLASLFNAEWASEASSLHALGADLVLRHRARLEVATVDPAHVLGRDLGGALPQGSDAPALVRLMTEIQMWLHALPPEPAIAGINGLWLWGAGQEPLSGTPRWPAFADFDPFLTAARRAHPGPARADAELVRWSVARLISTGATLAAADRKWFAPLAASLRSGRLAAAELHLLDSTVRLAARQRWRFWIRPQPWWELGA